jgi:pimeloyl-ACP methyl ester carboxylesterase
MTTYVLIAGSQHGGWCWDDVAAILRAEGHEVLAPTLTGLVPGDDARGLDVRLRTHVDDIVRVFSDHDLRDVVLVAHSYGGVPAGVAATELTGRVSRLILLDALVPVHGRSAADVVPPLHAELFVSSAVDGWVPPSEDSLGRWGIDDDALHHRVWPRLAAHPLATVTDVAELARPLDELSVPLIYLYATQKVRAADLVVPSAERAKASAAWSYHELDAPHDCMLTHPELTAELLVHWGHAPVTRTPSDA